MTTRKSPPKRPGRPDGRSEGPGREKRAPQKRRSSPRDIKKAGPKPAAVSAADETGDRGERIAKVMARAGLCSRREAETWIENGRVQLNGTLLTTPAVTVTSADKVLVDGEPLPMRERTRLWLYHKPRGLMTTNKDPEGRPTVFERLPRDLPRVLSVGRLDFNTEGLLLLTNDGGLARVLELPATGWLRRYRVRAFGKVTQADLDGLKDGVAIEGVLYGAIEATLDKEQGNNVWMTVGLREGKNREVKRVLEHLGLAVNRLIRISYGPFQLMDMPDGDVREIRGRVLRDQLGDALAEEAGADFDAPIFNQAEPEAARKPSGAKRDQTRAGGRAGERKPAGRQDAGRRDSGPREGGYREGGYRERGPGEPGRPDARKPDSRRGDSKRPDRKQSDHKQADYKRADSKRSDGRRSDDRHSESRRPEGRREEGGQGKWLTAREGKSETDRRKTAKAERSEQKKSKRQNAGPRQEKVSPRSRFRMTSEPKPRKDYGEERRTPRPRKIWGEEGLVEDKQQQNRSDSERRDPPKGGRGPRGGGRS